MDDVAEGQQQLQVAVSVRVPERERRTVLDAPVDEEPVPEALVVVVAGGLEQPKEPAGRLEARETSFEEAEAELKDWAGELNAEHRDLEEKAEWAQARLDVLADK